MQNQITSNLFLFRYFVHPPGVAYTAWNRGLSEYTLYIMNILIWNGRTNLMNNTREQPEIWFADRFLHVVCYTHN